LDWLTIKDFVKTIARNFNIGPSGVQVGVVTHGGSPVNAIRLNQATSYSTLATLIDNLPYQQGANNLAGALGILTNTAFIPGNGGRGSTVQQIAIVVSYNAFTSDAPSVSVAASQVLAAGVKLYGIGTTINADPNTIATVSSSPHVANANYFLLSATSQLYSIIPTLLNELCPTQCMCDLHSLLVLGLIVCIYCWRNDYTSEYY
jgi:hypothetical protein